jgi:asparagine synthase (glutamine-hydrolysing)
MENKTLMKCYFSLLISGDYSSLSDFKHLNNSNVDFFVNGNLYNYSEEILFNNYLNENLNAFKSIDGDFLIIIIENKKIHLIRDRHGAGSQLFYSNNYCSTNLLEFTDLKGFDCKPNYEAIFTFLSIGYVPSPLTSLEGIKKLNPGFVLTYENSVISTQDLFGYDEYMKNVGTSTLSLEDATMEYEQLHKKAIKDRISNKKKIGLLLSGGYDSGGNISALRDIYDGEIVSFSIGFKDNPWTELPLAKVLAQKYNSKHYEYEIDGSEIMNLPQIIGITGDPFQEAGLMVNFTAMQLVRNSGENPQIILGGDGNDQHFGTFGKELAIHWKMKNSGLQIFQKLYDIVGNNFQLFDKDNIFFRTEFHNRKILHIQQSDVFGFSLIKLNKMNTLGYKLKQFTYLKNTPHKYENFDKYFFSRNFNIDIKQIINEVILFKSSRMSEAFGNKISFPYMSTDLYRFLNSMPLSHKLYGNTSELTKGKGVSKFLHKRYLQAKLPTEITNRKKQGGFAPLPIFLKDDKQRKIIFDILRKSDAIKNIFNTKDIENLFQQYETIINSKSYWFWFQQVKANQIINLLTLAVWWEMFINKRTGLKSVSELIE